MRDLGIAQLGSLGVVDDKAFASTMALKTINRLLPILFRDLYPDGRMEQHAPECESAMDLVAARIAAVKAKIAAATAAARAATAAAYAAYAAADAAAYAAAAYAADADAAAAAAADAAAAYAAAAAARAADATAAADKYLNLSASIALETLRELSSPGIALL